MVCDIYVDLDSIVDVLYELVNNKDDITKTTREIENMDVFYLEDNGFAELFDYQMSCEPDYNENKFKIISSAKPQTLLVRLKKIYVIINYFEKDDGITTIFNLSKFKTLKLAREHLND